MASSFRSFAILLMPPSPLWFCEPQCHKAVDFSPSKLIIRPRVSLFTLIYVTYDFG